MRDASIKLGYFVLVLLVLYGVWSFFFRVMGNHNIDELLRQTDAAIASKEYDAAQLYLRRINRQRLSEYDRLRILARIFELGNATNDFSYLEKESASAIRAYKNREDFKAFHIFSLLENNKITPASKMAERYLFDLRFKDIRARAILSNLFKESSNPFIAAKEALEANRYGQYYLNMASLLNDPRLYFNASLLFMDENNLTEARNLIPAFAHSATIPATSRALLIYELGEYDLAFDILSNQPIQYLQDINAIVLLADIHLVRKNYLLALELYRTALSMDTQFSPTLWVNTALLTEKFYPENSLSAISILMQGFNLFPDDTQIVMALTQRMSDQRTAQEIVLSFMEKFPNNATIYLFWLKQFTSENHLLTINSKLWDLFNFDSSSQHLAQYMVWFFLGQRNFDDAKIILNRYTGDNKEWITSYQALIAALDSNFDQALTLLETNSTSWENLYNYSVIMMATNQYEVAINNLISIAAIYRARASDEFDASQFSQIQAMLARSYLNNHQFGLAESAAREALRNDQNNSQALQVLQELAKAR